MEVKCHHLEAWLQSELTPEQHEMLDQHVTSCPECAEVVERWAQECQSSLDTELAQANARVAIPPQLHAQVESRLLSGSKIPAAAQRAPGRLWPRLWLATAALVVLALGVQQVSEWRSQNSSSDALQAVKPVQPILPDGLNPQEINAAAAEPISLAPHLPVATANFHPSVRGRGDFIVAEQSTDDDEIPFFIVVPSTQRVVSDNNVF